MFFAMPYVFTCGAIYLFHVSLSCVRDECTNCGFRFLFYFILFFFTLLSNGEILKKGVHEKKKKI